MLSEDQVFSLLKLILGYNNVKQSMENSIGVVHDLSKSASGAMTNFKIVYDHMLSVDKVFFFFFFFFL